MKILIVDFGREVLRALLVEKQGKKLLIKESKKIKSPTIIDWTEFDKLEKFTVVESLSLDKDLDADYTLFNINSRFLDNRFLILPFKDKKRVAQALPMELEDYVPFEMEDYVLDWQIIGGASKLYKTFVLLLEKSVLEQYVRVLQNSKLDPEVLYSDFDFFCNLVREGELYKFLNIKYYEEKKQKVEKEGKKETKDKEEEKEKEETKNILFLNFGAEKIDIVIFNEDKILDATVVQYAGDYITKTIVQDYKISYEDAEIKKRGAKVILENLSKDTDEAVNLSEVIISALDIIVRETNQFVVAFQSSTKTYVDNVLIVGNGAKVENLKQYIAQELGMSLVDFDRKKLLEDKGIKVGDNELDDDFLPVYSSLLKFVEHRTWKGFNFRKDTYSKEYSGEGLKEFFNLFKPVVKLLGILVIVFFVYTFIYAYILSWTVEDEQNKLKELTTKVFFDKGPRARMMLLEDLDRLVFEVQNKKRLYLKTKTKGFNTTIDMLGLVSRLAKDKGNIKIKELEITDGALKIKEATANTAETVQNFAQALQDLKIFEEVNVGTVKIAVDGVSKNFSLLAKFKKRKKK